MAGPEYAGADTAAGAGRSGAVRRARSLLAMLRNPKLRRSLGAVFSGTATADDAGPLRGAVSLGAVELSEDGAPVFVESFLGEAVADLDRVLGPLAVLDGARIDVKDLALDAVDDAVRAVAVRVLDEGERVTESELNGRLRLFVQDVAFFRRHAFDLGVYERAADGSAYWRVEG
ncbi:hypothetical protein FM125_04555 [Micrococcus lylae]|uniref:DUF2087 domain-containing protein n=1 Tax=Micrococcus lylae TaxID=1273 RepID=A0A1R4IUA6_9MICC|nr:DUF2087 domain-containing protein [Micrococcus lylae]SJN23249.1 hypothetical protein FM125_04555 [Micrococcus lylae]